MIQRFFKDSILYAVPNFIAALIAFFLLPIYTRLLSPKEYGIVEIIILASTFLNILFSLEIIQGFARLFPEAQDKQEKIIYSSTSFWFIVFVFSLFLFTSLSIPSVISKFIFNHEQPPHLVITASLIIVANALYYHVINILRWDQQSRPWAITRLLYLTIYNGMAVLFLSMGYGLYGFLIGQFIGFSLALVNGIVACKKTTPIKLIFNTDKLKEMLGFSTPLIFSSIASYMNIYTDRWMLSFYFGMTDVGIYSVAFRVASLITLIIAGFQQAFVPLVYHNYKKPGTKEAMVDIFRYFLVFLFPLIAVLSLLADNLLAFLVDESFQAGAELIPWLTLSIFFLNIYFFAPGMGLTKKTKKIAYTSIIAASTNVLLNLMLIPVYGRIGAVLGTLGGGIVMTSFYFYWSNKEYSVPYPWFRIFFVALGLGAILLLNSNLVISFFHKILILLVFFTFVFISLLNKSDLNKIANSLNHIFVT